MGLDLGVETGSDPCRSCSSILHVGGGESKEQYPTQEFEGLFEGL